MSMRPDLPRLPVVLLVVVAVAQVITATTTDLTPWKGGGFGMFSTGDSSKTRQVRVYSVGVLGKSRRIPIPVDSANLVRAAQTFPSPGRLSALARHVAGRLPEESRKAVAVRVEIWRGRFESDPARLVFTKWREAQVDVRR